MQLSDLFSEIIEVDSNPYKLQIEEVFKINGELKREKREEIYHLIPYLDIDKDIINHILLNCEIVELKKTGNLFNRLLSKHPLSKLELDNFDVVISNNKILSRVKCESKIELEIDKLIIARKGNILINKQNKLFYINIEDYKVYSIK
jgi:hypothetical protein